MAPILWTQDRREPQARFSLMELLVALGLGLLLWGVVLQLQTPSGAITYTVGSPPSAIWRRRVLMRCGPTFGLDGEPSAGAAQNRVLLDGLALPGLEAQPEPDGLLQLLLRQEFAPSGGGNQWVEPEVRVATP